MRNQIGEELFGIMERNDVKGFFVIVVDGERNGALSFGGNMIGVVDTIRQAVAESPNVEAVLQTGLDLGTISREIGPRFRPFGRADYTFQPN